MEVARLRAARWAEIGARARQLHRCLTKLVNVLVTDASGIDVALRIADIKRPTDDMRQITQTLTWRQRLEGRIRSLGNGLDISIAILRITKGGQ